MLEMYRCCFHCILISNELWLNIMHLCMLVSLIFSIDGLYMFMGLFSRLCLGFVASSLPVWGMGTWQNGIRALGCSNGPLWAKKMRWQKVELPSLFSRAAASFKNCLSVLTVGKIGGIDFRCSRRFNIFPSAIADGEVIPRLMSEVRRRPTFKLF